MARQLRILYPGAWYHVMNRGVNKQRIFFEKKHRHEFINLLEHISKVYKAEIHAYCLMSNHYHLLLRTWEPNLPELMQYLNSVYTARLNKDLSRDGPLFRGRFKAILVDSDEYLLPLSRYIHLNPLEARLTNQMKDDCWSSYPYYIGDRQKPTWFHTDFIQEYFNEENFVEEYTMYMSEGNDPLMEEFYSRKTVKSILGSNKFIKNLKIKKPESKEISDYEYFNNKLPLLVIADVIAKVTQQSPENVKQSCPGKSNQFRNIFIYLSRHMFSYKVTEIAKFLSNRHYSGISSTLKSFQKKLSKSKELLALVAICKMQLEFKASRLEL